MYKTIIVIMGYPALGNSKLAKEYEKQGFCRLNRELCGGSLDDLVQYIEHEYIDNDITGFVLDDTYPTVESRKSVIKWAQDNNFHIICIYVDNDIGDATYKVEPPTKQEGFNGIDVLRFSRVD